MSSVFAVSYVSGTTRKLCVGYYKGLYRYYTTYAPAIVKKVLLSGASSISSGSELPL